MIVQNKRILIAEEDPVLKAILTDWFQNEGWLIDTAQNGLEVVRKVHIFNPDIILMEMDLQGRDGIATAQILRRDLAIGNNIPIIMMAASPKKEQLINAVKVGCNDFILKPFKFEAIMSRVEKFIVSKNKKKVIEESVSYQEDEREAEIIVFSKQALKKAFSDARDGKNIDYDVIQNTVNKMIEILTEEKNLPMAFKMKSYDEYTYLHSINVTALSMSFAFHIKWDIGDIQTIGEGSFLHDIGKTKIDANIVMKPEKLTDAEFDEIKKHPVFGAEIAKNQNCEGNVLKLIIEHHENIDGSGYPYKLRNEQMSKFGKLVSIVDSYDAMTTDSSYRKAMDTEQAILVMSQLSEFDPELFKKFKTLIHSEIIGK